MDAITRKDDKVSEQIRLEWQEIAKSEVSRHRRKLGALTSEQQSVVESVLVHIANQLFEQLRLEGVPQPVRRKCLNLWRRDAVATL
ncbi:MAG TPA: hypothetical protein VIG25_07225 [Pyrinomonadaceae bacterium]|jgi:hypothetical protein